MEDSQPKIKTSDKKIVKPKPPKVEKTLLKNWKPKISNTKETVIIYAHPYSGSFCHAILEAAILGLQSQNKPFKIIDLNSDKFNPTYEVKDLRYYNQGDTTDALVKKYIEYLLNAHELIFIYPIWWNERPAILKGFCDKVFVKDYFWEPKNILRLPVLWGKATWIKKVRIFTVSNSPMWIQRFVGNSAKKGMINGTLKALKMHNVKRKNFSLTTKPHLHQRQAWLGYVERECAKNVYQKND